ncbi:hypothetical protein EDC56_2258 [Sinobacterium caligoides]|uniref:Sel1 repeat family protein n=1 Tax=Sinobacterium caligoides TaxID=933926 RepID=A0A3N2DPV3_9GAMM|nr:tetratricopeptide repeat protein [Sinobacterium caligoides]ROS01810.1 hypothetical protein EDC56_2258 [Sinobacterium caligoides]
MALWDKIKQRLGGAKPASAWAVRDIVAPSGPLLVAEQAFCQQYNELATEPAFELCLEQAEAGIRAAQYFTGLFFDSGNAGLQDFVRARDFYYRAALQDSPEAQYNLATLLMMGRGGDQDLAQAFAWYQCAAENGIAQAQFNCGSMLDEGYGVKAEPGQARHWYQAAARQGYPQACQNMAASCYEANEFTESYAWAMLAAAGKVDGADQLLSLLAEQLSREDINAAKQCGDEYFALYAPELRRQEGGVASFDPNATEVVNTTLL